MSTSDHNSERSFLGRGWNYPVCDMTERAIDKRQVLVDREEDDIKQAIRIILGTSQGDRVMRPEFGAGLRELLFEPVSTSTIELAKVRVEEALRRWEHRINVVDIQVSHEASGRNGKLQIVINYQIRSTNTQDNLIYPFYLDEVYS